ncbi:unnamed protein product [Prunus armeniaca]
MILSDIPLKESCWQYCLPIIKKEGRYQQGVWTSLRGRARRESNHKWNDLAANLVVEDEAWEPEQ